MNQPLIPERLKAARENLGITMAEASRRMNLSKIGYCRYEYGDRTPSPQMTEMIAQTLHTSVAYLTGQTEDMNPDTILISRSESPELFQLANLCRCNDSEMVRRLLMYAGNILSNKE